MLLNLIFIIIGIAVLICFFKMYGDLSSIEKTVKQINEKMK